MLPVEVTGRQLSPAVPALALVGLAGALALLATRAAGRRLAGLLLVLAGFGVAAAAFAGSANAVTALMDEAGVAVGTRTAPITPPDRSAWPWVAASGGALVALAGGLAAVRGPRWPVLSGRYDAPGGPGRTRPSTGDGMWAALDRGEDPTD